MSTASTAATTPCWRSPGPGQPPRSSTSSTSLRGRDLVTTAIVATPGTPVTELADRTILLPEVDEKSVVQTRFATSTIALLRAALGEDMSAAIEDARAVLAEDEAQCLAGVADAEQVTFVGRGWTIGLAAEAALKLRESAQFWTESYPAMEYRHGPVSIATTGRATWALGEVPPGLEAQVRDTGAHFESRDIDPLAELVRVHRLCLAKARQGDLDPDHPRHLTRSVVLPPDADVRGRACPRCPTWWRPSMSAERASRRPSSTASYETLARITTPTPPTSRGRRRRSCTPR